MARAFEELATNTRAADLDHAEWLGLLLDRELTDRQDRRLRARLRYARLRHNAAVEDIDYRTSRGLDRALFQKLAQGGWIKEQQNLIIVGPSGVGKSWLPAHHGLPAHSDIGHVETISRSCISGSHACSAILHWHGATVATPG
jgi:DNA replication protein DnaC